MISDTCAVSLASCLPLARSCPSHERMMLPRRTHNSAVTSHEVTYIHGRKTANGGNMVSVYYTTIHPRINQTVEEVIAEARSLGYELQQFAGWCNRDYPSRAAEISANSACIQKIERSQEIDLPGLQPIVDQCGVVIAHSEHVTDAPAIKSFQPSKARIMEEDEALAMIRGVDVDI